MFLHIRIFFILLLLISFNLCSCLNVIYWGRHALVMFVSGWNSLTTHCYRWIQLKLLLSVGVLLSLFKYSTVRSIWSVDICFIQQIIACRWHNSIRYIIFRNIQACYNLNLVFYHLTKLNLKRERGWKFLPRSRACVVQDACKKHTKYFGKISVWKN